MIVVYRNGTLGWYIEAFADHAYRYWFTKYAWEGCWPSECCWMVPPTSFDTY